MLAHAFFLFCASPDSQTPTFGGSPVLTKPNLKLTGNEEGTPLNDAYYTSLSHDTLPPLKESVLTKGEWYKGKLRN